MDLAELREEMAARLQPLFIDSKLRLELEASFEGIAAMETPASAEIVKAAEEMTGHSAEAVAFGTEGPYLQQIGMEPIILGPGDIDQAHQPNEFLGLERIQPMIDILQKLIHRFCL
jgi:acetylornithine deacetylase